MTAYYWGSSTGNWTAALWSTSPSAGPYTAGPPTATDDALFNALSTGTCTLVVGATCQSLVASGGGIIVGDAFFLTMTGKNSSGISLFLDGTVNVSTGTVELQFTDTSGTVNKITTGGNTFRKLLFQGVGGSWQLQDQVTLGGAPGSFSVTAGTVDFNSQAISCLTFSSTGISTRSILASGATLTVTGASFTVANTGLTATWPSKITFSPPPGGTIFTGGGLNYNAIEITGVNSFAFADANGFTSLKLDAAASARTLTFFDSGTYTIGSMSLYGSAGNLLTVNSSSGGTPATIVGTGGQPFYCDYITLQDNHLSGVQGFVGPNSTLVSGNSGWASGVFLSAATNIKLSGVASPTGRAILAASGKIATQARAAAHGVASLAAATGAKVRGAAAAAFTFPAAARTATALRATSIIAGVAGVATAAKISIQSRAAISGRASVSAAASLKVRGAAAAAFTAALGARTAAAAKSTAVLAGATSLAAASKIAVRTRAAAAGAAFLAAASTIQVHAAAAASGTAVLAARASIAVQARAAKLGYALSGSTSFRVFGRAVMKLFRPSPRVAVAAPQSRSVAAPSQNRTAVAPAGE